MLWRSAPFIVALSVILSGCLPGSSPHDDRSDEWRGRTRLELERLVSPDERAVAARQLLYLYEGLTRKEKTRFRLWVGPKILAHVKKATHTPPDLVRLLDLLDPRSTKAVLETTLERARTGGQAGSYVAAANALLRRSRAPRLAVHALTVANATGNGYKSVQKRAEELGCARLSEPLVSILEGKDRDGATLLSRFGLHESQAGPFAIRAAANAASLNHCTDVAPALLAALETNKTSEVCTVPLARAAGILGPADVESRLIEFLRSDQPLGIRAGAAGVRWLKRPSANIKSVLMQTIERIGASPKTDASGPLLNLLVNALSWTCGPGDLPLVRRLEGRSKSPYREWIATVTRTLALLFRCKRDPVCLARLSRKNNGVNPARIALEMGRRSWSPATYWEAVQTLKAMATRRHAAPELVTAVRVSLNRLLL